MSLCASPAASAAVQPARCLRLQQQPLARQVAVNRAATRPARRGALVCRAALDSSTSLAVTQQLTALGVYIGMETGVSFATLKPGAEGRPALPVAGAGIAGLLAMTQLIPAEDTSSAGLAAGAAICGALMAWNIKRAIATKHDPAEWPGPKAWPASAAVSSFFGLVLCLESLF
mmetsp:Transcript_24018/g.61607  ORF Transcript_24018/g.61607 Transcript_24018/m.61607 type:complete len:173 (-) Transcript_24018:108-626(-)|eukprot:jgi/Tetstr1/427027/TSEL_017232.t1